MTTIEVTERQAKVLEHVLKSNVYRDARKGRKREYDKAYHSNSERVEVDKALHAKRYRSNKFVGVENVIPFLSRVAPFEGEFGEWVTGFFEGDGNFHYYAGAVTFAQKEVEVLRYIREEVKNGSLNWNGQIWLLSFYREEAARLIKTFQVHVSCPHRVEQIEAFCEVGLHEPTKHWFSGFWDAEGSSSVSQSGAASVLAIQVGQKDRVVLDALKVLWGFGDVYAYGVCSELRFNSERAWSVGQWLLGTSRNGPKRRELQCKMYAIQEYQKRRRLD